MKQQLLKSMGLLLLMAIFPLQSAFADEPEFKENIYYRIISKKSGARCIDIAGEKSYEGEKICLWSNITSRTTEDWAVRKVGNYYQFLSRHGGWALNDPTTGEVTATTNTGTQLNLAAVDTTSNSQLWKLVEQAGGYFNIINVHTDHTMNINGGNDADGTQIISYKSEPSSGNQTSDNRKWRFAESDSINGNSGDSIEVDTTKSDTIIRRLSNLPHVYINTANGKSITSKKDFLKAEMYYIDENDSIRYFESLEIRGRGNSTWNRQPSKLPYRIRFAEAVELLGPDFANARNWTLMANAYDKSIMRNALTSELSDFVGLPFSPAHKFIDLTINGVYVGTYHISDHPEVGEKRVDIPLGTTGTDISYFLECDGYAEHNYFTTTKKSVPIRIHYPKDKLTAAQKAYATRLVNTFETRLFSDNFTDPENGYRALIDSVSLANWYVADEICGNLDGFWSLYFYRKAGDPKIYMGPMWDYDIAYGNDSRRGDTSKSLMVDVAFELDRAGSWIVRMWEDPWFQQLINRRYKEVYDAGVKDYLIQKVDSMAALLDESQQLNYKKYGIRTAYYNERVFHDTYAEYITDLKDYIDVHTDYLIGAFKSKIYTGPTPEFQPEGNYYYHIKNANGDVSIDIANQNIAEGSLCCIWADDATRETENWIILPQEDKWQILTHDGKMALNDPSAASISSTSTTVVQLNLAAPDATSARQLWTIVPQGTLGYYNLINKQTGRTMNLNEGKTDNGTKVISYSTDETKNKTSLNRLWYIEKQEGQYTLSIDEDVNQDGFVNSLDVLKIYKFMQTSVGEESGVIEDVNKDEKVNSLDVLKVYKYMQSH